MGHSAFSMTLGPVCLFHRNIRVGVKALRCTGDKVLDTSMVNDYSPRVIQEWLEYLNL